MSVTKREIDQTYASLRGVYGGERDDYFGLLYLEREFGLSREVALTQVAFGNCPHGIDAFHLDAQRQNLYLFHFKWSDSPGAFKQPLEGLVDGGLARVFADAEPPGRSDPLVERLKSQILNDRALVDAVLVRCVFRGDPRDAARSMVLDALCENLEEKKHLVDRFFHRPVLLAAEFRSAESRQVGGMSHRQKTFRYRLALEETLEREGPARQKMHVGFARLIDLHAMYRDMGIRFFERNIRGGLSESKAANRAVSQAFHDIVFDKKEPPTVFPFYHNGVTIFAERLERVGDQFEITEPRMLNGAQTLDTFDTFLACYERGRRLAANWPAVEAITVLCKIITEAERPFVLSVAINNNRQNPVMPWNLRANDMIQLQLQDKFRDDLHVYYERQEGMFRSFTDEDLEEMQVTYPKPIELLRLAKTFLASDGLMDKMGSMRRVFENDKDYQQVFNEKRLRADSRKIVLCYKIQFRLRALTRAIMETGTTKYGFMGYARNLLWALLCQAILNDENLKEYAEELGDKLRIERDYMTWVTRLATSRARMLIGSLIVEEPYAQHMANENYTFLRTQAFFRECMHLADARYGWVRRRLT